jgi:RNA-directed DNA polymerase
VLAEIALQGIDTLFESRTGIWYNRYVDDILILGPAGVARSTAYELIAELKALKLNPHDFEPGSKSKVESLTDTFSFLGYQIDGGQVLIRQ